jgi:hypothetical protein
MPVDSAQTNRSTRPLQFYDDRSYDPNTGEIVRINALKDQTDFGVNGYAVLQVEGATLKVSYRDIPTVRLLQKCGSLNNGMQFWPARIGHPGRNNSESEFPISVFLFREGNL